MANDVVAARGMMEGVTAVEERDDDVGAECVQSKDTDAKAVLTLSASEPSVRWLMWSAAIIVVALSVLVGWLGYQDYQMHQVRTERQRFVDTARQGALNLTTIDWQHADADVRRIMDGATGEFYNDFANRSQPFVDVLKQAKASSVGTVTDAGLESQAGDIAQTIVSVAVKTTNAAAAQQVPRAWRMRIAVQKIGDQMKVSNVEFVP